MDLRAYDLAAALLDELTAALSATRAGQVDQAVVHPGNMVPQYGCSVAAVRVVTIAPADTTKSPACPPEFQVTYEMTVDRCYRTPEDNGMPALAVLDSAARDALEDAGAMRRAAACAWGSQRRRYGVWMPRGPDGGIHGGTMQVTALGVTLTCGCGEDWAGIDSRVPPLPGDPVTG